MTSFFSRLAGGHRQREMDDDWSNTARRKLRPRGNLGLKILHDCDEPTVDIVAVHGLGANPDYAWVWLPKNNPPDSHGYPTTPLNWLKSAPQQRLSNISDNLLSYLANSRDKMSALNRPLIFIGHSFGGNIIEQAIVASSRNDSLHLRISECTVGVLFLGTPHRGSSAAAWGAMIASMAPPGFVSEARLLKALEDQSDALKDRVRDFTCWLFSESVPVVCAFEKLATDYSSRLGVAGRFLSPMLVVPESSACIDGHRTIALDADHIRINKFYGSNDPSFTLIYPWILRISSEAKETLNRRHNPTPIPISEISTSGSIKKCLQQMRVRNPEYILADIERSRGKTVGHTCEWILTEAKFCAWSTNARNGFLRLIGSPGIGKTMLATFLVRVLKAKVEKSQGRMFAYFFFDDKDRNRNTPTALLRSLIWQLLLQNNDLFKHIEPDFEKHPDSSIFDDLFSDFSALWGIFHNITRDPHAGEIFILIDALDECDASRRDLLVSFRSLAGSGLFGEVYWRVKILTTYRLDVDDIDSELSGISPAVLRIDSVHINNDLSEYIDSKVDELAQKKRYTPKIRSKVSSTLKQRSGGTFLWASLMIAELGRPEVRMLDVGTTLNSLPKGLDNTYAVILDRIEPANQDYAQFILLCMVAARRPLKVTEMRTAFAVWKTSSMESEEDLSIYDDILTVCSSILYESSGDEPTINFCHQSVKDFLLHEQSTTSKWYHMTEDEANFCIFKVCWTCLSAEECNYGKPTLDSWKIDLRRNGRCRMLEKRPSWHLFLEYSRFEWENHALASSAVLLRDRQWLAIDVAKAPKLRDAWLLRAAREGYEGIVKLLIDKGSDIEANDLWSQSPLSCAAGNGRETTVKLLLDKGARIEAKNQYARTPLWRAVSGGHFETTKLLLNNGANIETKDSHDQTPLTEAARLRHEAIVGLLLDKGANVEAKNIVGFTPLLMATTNEGRTIVQPTVSIYANHTIKLMYAQKAIVTLLLDKGAKIEARDELYQTPLMLAASNGNYVVVRLLVDKGAEVNARDRFGQTPLYCAAASGDETVVQILLDAGADIDSEDTNGMTALQVAAHRGNAEVMRLLVNNGAKLDANDVAVYEGIARPAEAQSVPLNIRVGVNRPAEAQSVPLNIRVGVNRRLNRSCLM
ncbi:hypothetical protein NQ176_g3080 [Zarea fungicola]|uniref:Uncharacterized protein n=1 Tax=Zarea fungicola TaxID=93591 RepID=A0ACC1NKW4_9HYPO|nr:hypothetical protein NQ176_g3080 [Lecanicillium fungicola]